MHGIKFPRTYHFPYSPGVSSDDKVRKEPFPDKYAEYVMLEKMDGENTTMGRDYIHARSTVGYPSHWSRGYMKAKWDFVRWRILPVLALHGENLVGVHSIEYKDLYDCFMVFGIRDVEKNLFLSWDETVRVLSDHFGNDLRSVPVIATLSAEQVNDEKVVMGHFQSYCSDQNREVEGFVVRPVDEFRFSEYADVVGKWVRANHVQTDEHWMKSSPRYNGFPR